MLILIIKLLIFLVNLIVNHILQPYSIHLKYKKTKRKKQVKLMITKVQKIVLKEKSYGHCGCAK